MLGADSHPGVTHEMFAELVADLRAELAEISDEERKATLARPRLRAPTSFAGRPWVQWRVTLREAAADAGGLTELRYNSLRVYRNAGDKDRTADRETPRSMPAESQADGGGWIVGQLAVWIATSHASRSKTRSKRWPDHSTYYPRIRELAKKHSDLSVNQVAADLGVTRHLAARLLTETGVRAYYTDDALMPFLQQLARAEGRRLTVPRLMDALDQAGYNVGADRAKRLYILAGGKLPAARPRDGAERAPGESRRFDGLLTSTEVVLTFDVRPSAITNARNRGELTPAGYTTSGNPLYDPDKITHRQDFWPAPIDRGHPLAAE